MLPLFRQSKTKQFLHISITRVTFSPFSARCTANTFR